MKILKLSGIIAVIGKTKGAPHNGNFRLARL